MDLWNPAIAVASLLVGVVASLTSAFSRAIGGLVHLRSGAVHLGPVRELVPRWSERLLRRSQAVAPSLPGG